MVVEEILEDLAVAAEVVGVRLKEYKIALSQGWQKSQVYDVFRRWRRKCWRI